MNDNEIIDKSGAVAEAALIFCAQHELPPEQAAKMAMCVIVDVLTRLFGSPVATIECLRDAADRLESELLKQV